MKDRRALLPDARLERPASERGPASTEAYVVLELREARTLRYPRRRLSRRSGYFPSLTRSARRHIWLAPDESDGSALRS
jgi:hypothetical protein